MRLPTFMNKILSRTGVGLNETQASFETNKEIVCGNKVIC